MMDGAFGHSMYMFRYTEYHILEYSAARLTSPSVFDPVFDDGTERRLKTGCRNVRVHVDPWSVDTHAPPSSRS